MLPRFKEWAKKWTANGFDAETNEHIFTHDTYRLFRRIMLGINRWFLSDPWILQPDGSYLPMDMYFQLTDGEYVSCKESSIIESMHHVTNRMETSIGGQTVSDKTRNDLILHGGYNWNIRRMQKLGLLPDLPHTDLSLMHALHEKKEKLGIPTEKICDLASLPRPPYEKEEGSVYGWDLVRSARSGNEAPLVTTKQRKQLGKEAAIALIEKAVAASLALQSDQQEIQVPLKPVAVMLNPPKVWLQCSPIKPQPQELSPLSEYVDPQFLEIVSKYLKEDENEEQLLLNEEETITQQITSQGGP